jgi:hypothetical protein
MISKSLIDAAELAYNSRGSTDLRSRLAAVLRVAIPDRVFVFGSNLSGVHGAGAAHFAMQHRGATWGLGVGPSGNSYAIPTKDEKIDTLPLSVIQVYVRGFLAYARANPEINFEVTPIGTGLAGYTHGDIAPMFRDAPLNCDLPVEWSIILNTPTPTLP